MLKNVLIVVDDIEKSIEFYKDLFGLQVILQNEGNVILSEGLVLQYHRIRLSIPRKCSIIGINSCTIQGWQKQASEIVPELLHSL